jgi:hypothetical protein
MVVEDTESSTTIARAHAPPNAEAELGPGAPALSVALNTSSSGESTALQKVQFRMVCVCSKRVKQAGSFQQTQMQTTHASNCSLFNPTALILICIPRAQC